jgi:hypothetical protein
MFMAALFILMFIAIISIWLDKRMLSMYVFAVSFVGSIGIFFHHITDVIGLSL